MVPVFTGAADAYGDSHTSGNYKRSSRYDDTVHSVTSLGRISTPVTPDPGTKGLSHVTSKRGLVFISDGADGPSAASSTDAIWGWTRGFLWATVGALSSYLHLERCA
jgi:hypothetical protein